MSLVVYDGAGRLYNSKKHTTNNDGEERCSCTKQSDA